MRAASKKISDQELAAIQSGALSAGGAVRLARELNSRNAAGSVQARRPTMPSRTVVSRPASQPTAAAKKTTAPSDNNNCLAADVYASRNKGKQWPGAQGLNTLAGQVYRFRNG